MVQLRMRDALYRRLGRGFALLALLGATSARAETEPSAATMQTARKLFSEGLALVDASNQEGARLKFLEAWQLVKAPSVLFNLARAEQLTGHLTDAFEHYRLFQTLSVSDPKISASLRTRAQEYLAEVTAKIGQLRVEAPADSSVTLDGAPLAEQPRSEPRAVVAGKHVVTAALGSKRATVEVECAPGVVTNAVLGFEATSPIALAEAPALGRESDTAHSWSTAKTATVATLSAGAVIAATSALIFRNSAASNLDEAKALLGGRGCVGDDTSALCARARTLHSDHDAAMTRSSVAWTTTGVLALGTAAAVLLWPRSPAVASASPNARGNAGSPSVASRDQSRANARDSFFVSPSLGHNFTGATFHGQF